MDAAATEALIDEAAKKSGLVWVRAAGRHHREQAVWHVWHEGAFFVLTGGLEQPAPDGLGDASDGAAAGGEDAHAFVSVVSKDKGSRLVTVETLVEIAEPGSEVWDEVLPALQSKRLNLPDGDAAPQRWARECTLWRLTPTGTVTETPDEPSTSSHAAEPPPSPGRSRVPRPLHLRGRPSRNRGGR